MKRRILVALAVVTPLAIFLALRQAANWRPQLMTENSSQTWLMKSPSEPFCVRSRSGRWAAIMTSDQNAILVDRLRGVDGLYVSLRPNAVVGQPMFSADERFMGIVWPVDMGLDFYPRPASKIEAEVEDLTAHRKRRLQAVSCPAKVSDWGVSSCAFSPDGSEFVALTTANSILRWSVASGRLISQIQLEEQLSSDLELWADGAKLWAPGIDKMGNDQTLILNTRTGKRESVVNAGDTLLRDERFCWKSDGYLGGEVWIYRVSDGKQVFHRASDKNSETAMAGPIWSDDGKWMAIHRDQTTQLIEVGTWHIATQLQMARSRNWTFDDNNHILTQDDKGRVTRWRLR